MNTNDKILALVTVLIMDFDEIDDGLTAETRESMKATLLNVFVNRIKKLVGEK